MTDLAQKIREARRNTVDVSGFTFHFDRPTQAQAIDMYQEFGAALNSYELCFRFVRGWGNVKESDCIEGGSSTLAEWSLGLWEEWICDHQDIWPELGLAIADSYLAHEVALNDAGKA